MLSLTTESIRGTESSKVSAVTAPSVNSPESWDMRALARFPCSPATLFTCTQTFISNSFANRVFCHFHFWQTEPICNFHFFKQSSFACFHFCHFDFFLETESASSGKVHFGGSSHVGERLPCRFLSLSLFYAQIFLTEFVCRFQLSCIQSREDESFEFEQR